MLQELPSATLIHISDLHFAGNFTTDETEFKRWLLTVPVVKKLQGFCGHSYQAARALAIRINQIISDRRHYSIPVCVVFTGDLTRLGAKAEFQVGSKFLTNAHQTGTGPRVGLKLTANVKLLRRQSRPGVFSIPGNHDVVMCARPDVLGIYRRCFPGPFPTQCEIQASGKTIFLYGLDSTQNTFRRHVLARGRVAPQELEAVCRMLDQGRSTGAIQIVCVHHPISDPSHKAFPQQLDDREYIARRLTESGADLVIAGHVHEWFSAVEQKPPHAVTGTATQKFSDRSFASIDICNDVIHGTVFMYDRETREFVVKDAERDKYLVQTNLHSRTRSKRMDL